MGTDKDWEKWGATDAYFGVLSRAQFRTGVISEQQRDEFFATGIKHIANLLDQLRHRFAPDFTPRSALDFGCGVGRLTIPLARIADRVTAVDISSSMIAEARENCAQSGLHNVVFVESDDGLTRVQGSFDLIQSDIVLQHIAWRRGRNIIQALADRVAHNGYLAIQILTGCNASPFIRALVKLRYAFPPANWLRNLMKSRSLLEPAMQLHIYDLATIQSDLAERGFVVKHTHTAIPEFRSTWIYARRTTYKTV